MHESVAPFHRNSPKFNSSLPDVQTHDNAILFYIEYLIILLFNFNIIKSNMHMQKYIQYNFINWIATLWVSSLGIEINSIPCFIQLLVATIWFACEYIRKSNELFKYIHTFYAFSINLAINKLTSSWITLYTLLPWTWYSKKFCKNI